ncbi:hypothetical protein ACJX0J_012463, partial [Zea mays]
ILLIALVALISLADSRSIHGKLVDSFLNNFFPSSYPIIISYTICTTAYLFGDLQSEMANMNTFLWFLLCKNVFICYS